MTTTDAPAVPAIDIQTVTLGEMAALEAETSTSFDVLLSRGTATRRLVALWLADRRSTSSGRPRTWRELCDLRPLDRSSSASPSEPDSPSATSNG